MNDDRRHSPSAGPASPRGGEGVSRRNFIFKAGTMAGGMMLTGGAAALAAGVAVAPGAFAPIAFDSREPLRLALIGAGARMTNGLLPAILDRDDVEIVAVCDAEAGPLNRLLDRVERARGRRPAGFVGPREFEKLLAREDVQAVFAATPCDLHATILLEAMARGKAIYAEKPGCLTADEARRLRLAWSRATAIVQIGFQRRASARYREGIELLRAGEIGELVEARAVWSNAGAPPSGAGGWLARRERSGDWMLEQACHAWDVLAWATGAQPTRAFGAGRREPGRDVTDAYNATLEYPNGLVATFSHAWRAPWNDHGAFSGVHERLLGRKGGIDLTAGRASFADRDRAPRLLQPGEGDATRASVASFFDRLREGRAPDSTPENAADAALTGLMVRRAVDERRPVTMDEILAG